MGIFDHFKSKKQEVKPVKMEEKVKLEKKSDKPAKEEKPKTLPTTTAAKEIKGKTNQAYRILIKPLVTEKASHLAALNKYVFVVNPKMNKIEVKKAIRTIYKVEPVAVNILNFSGKSVRYGRTQGKTKSWKKAVVTLKEGDKIEVYEGV